MKLNRRERIRFDEQVAVQIADLVDNMREYHLGRTPSPILEVVRVYNTERAFAEKEPSSVKAFRIEPSELTEHIQKAWEIDTLKVPDCTSDKSLLQYRCLWRAPPIHPCLWQDRQKGHQPAH